MISGKKCLFWSVIHSPQAYIPFKNFVIIRDGDPLALQIVDRHYSRVKIGADRFMGPGQRLIMIEPTGEWLFAWRKCKYRLDNQEGWECSVFRNESEYISSEIIRWAEEKLLEDHGPTRVFTYVNPDKVKSPNPGYCFKKAGWKSCGKSKKGLLILEKWLV